MITVIDSIMGSGKTVSIINHMNNAHRDYLGLCLNDSDHLAPKFLYVAPLLSEVERITEACPGLNFRVPQSVNGRKSDHLDTLVEQGANICTTHALFKLLTKGTYEKLKAQNYTLIIDEALDCVLPFKDLSKWDRNLLLKDGSIYVESGTGRLRWNQNDRGDYSGEFTPIKNLCDNGNLILFRDVLLWEFPTEFLECFKQVFVLTYLFEGSPMGAHLRAAGLTWDLQTIKNGQLVSWSDDCDETEVKAKLRSLITIYEGSANACGAHQKKSNPFSKGWLEKRTGKALQPTKSTVENWFKKVAGTPSTLNAWTTYKCARKRLSGDRYARGFIPCNTKATNDYKHKKSLAYLCNVFHNPLIKGYFEARGIKVHEEIHALSEMIQWIWRSQIRDAQPINVFVPSERMRRLLKEWLQCANFKDLVITEDPLAA